jgi:hypothetical protein
MPVIDGGQKIDPASPSLLAHVLLKLGVPANGLRQGLNARSYKSPKEK